MNELKKIASASITIYRYHVWVFQSKRPFSCSILILWQISLKLFQSKFESTDIKLFDDSFFVKTYEIVSWTLEELCAKNVAEGWEKSKFSNEKPLMEHGDNVSLFT